jgi:hypothetical protein
MSGRKKNKFAECVTHHLKTLVVGWLIKKHKKLPDDWAYDKGFQLELALFLAECALRPRIVMPDPWMLCVGEGKNRNKNPLSILFAELYALNPDFTLGFLTDMRSEFNDPKPVPRVKLLLRLGLLECFRNANRESLLKESKIAQLWKNFYVNSKCEVLSAADRQMFIRVLRKPNAELTDGEIAQIMTKKLGIAISRQLVENARKEMTEEDSKAPVIDHIIQLLRPGRAGWVCEWKDFADREGIRRDEFGFSYGPAAEV